ncbi:MAG: hypothetical protein WC081_04045 [Candidatus Ratteibacteria bacterium]|jgi:hypothetical protein
MLSIEETKKILKDPNMSDEEATEIRDGFHSLVEIIFEQWLYEKQTKEKTDFSPLNKSKDFLYDETVDPPKHNPIINP